MRQRARVDANHTAIVDALRAAGCLVQSLAAVGKGVPDLLVANPWGQLFLLEVKDGKEDLTDDQSKWHQKWARCVLRSRTLDIVRSPEEALRAVGIAVTEKR